MSFAPLSDDQLDELVKVAAAGSHATLAYRMSSVERMSVFNLSQCKDLLKALKEMFPREKVLLSGNKPEVIKRIVDLAPHVLPARLQHEYAPAASPPRAFAPSAARRIDNRELPPSVREAARFVPPQAASGGTFVQRSFDGTGVSEAAFRALQAPHWHIVEILGVAPVRYAYHAQSEVRVAFEWPPESKRAFDAERGQVRVQLRVMLVDGKEARFRIEHQLLVNHEQVPLPPAVVPRKNIADPHFAPVGVDVSQQFAGARAGGVVPVSFANSGQWSGVLVAQLVRSLPQQALTAVVPMASIEIEQRYDRAPGGVAGGGRRGDLEELSFTISLDDPLVLERIRIPVQGSLCNHFQCFDLETYVEFCLQRSTWNCPVCNLPAPHAKLFRYRSFMNVLDRFPDAKLVVCNPDGSYVAHDPEQAQGKYERSVVQKRKIQKTGKREAVEIADDGGNEKTLKHARTEDDPSSELPRAAAAAAAAAAAGPPPPLLPFESGYASSLSDASDGFPMPPGLDARPVWAPRAAAAPPAAASFVPANFSRPQEHQVQRAAANAAASASAAAAAAAKRAGSADDPIEL